MKMLSNRIFLIIFFALLVIPGLGFKTGEIKLADNRMAANFPAVRITKDDGKIKRNKNFTTDAENYINDRIGGRDLMIKLHSMFAMMQSDRMTKDVLRGKNGFLFLGWDVSIESYANRTKLSEGQLENIKNYFDSVQRECKKSNIKFAFAIAPDKSKIYKENYPSLVKKLRPDSESAANQITEYLTGNLSAPYLYLADVLLANKEKGLLYYKYDTHWNHLGAYIGFGAMMRALGISFPQFNAQQKPGQAEDLYAMLNNNFYPKDNETYPYEINDSLIIDQRFLGSKKIKLTMSKNPNAMHNQPVLILGDSFSRHGFVDAARATFSVVYNTEETKYDIDKDVMDFARKNGIKIILLVAVERGAPSLANIKPTGK